VKFEDHSKQAKDAVDGNVKRALTAIGIAGLELIIDTMNTGYGSRPIYLTGTLQRDQKYRVDEEDRSVSWGVLQGDVSAAYAVYVHEGTYRMAKRPWLKDAIMGNKDKLRDVAEIYLKKGM